MINGTIYNTIRLQTLHNKWMQKKESGNVLSRKEVNERAKWTKEDWLKQNFMQQLEQDRQTSTRNEIAGKVMSGQALTPDEEKYLEQNDPQLLKTYKEAKVQKKEYKEKLKKCKTKDEVEKLKTQTLGTYLSSFKKIEYNPCIPISQKLATAQKYLGFTRNIEDAHEEFKRSGAYKKLPTQEEIEREENREYKEEQEVIIEDISENNDNEHKKETTIASEIEEIYQRIQFEAQMQQGDTNNKTFDEYHRSEKKIDLRL